MDHYRETEVDLEGLTLEEAIKQFKLYKPDATLSVELDYRYCWYESDIPGIKITIREPVASIPPRQRKNESR